MQETVLLVGGGGREHAIARALADSDTELYACAGNRNPGITELTEDVHLVDGPEPDRIVEYALDVDATLAVVGPEAYLEAGVVDALDDAGVYAFGPTADLARIETDKAFQREFMREHDIPGCPDYAVFEDTEVACSYIDEYDGDLAVKPAGLTGGKGVRVIGDQVTAGEAKAHLRDREYDQVVLEERLVGEEFTVQAFVADGEIQPTPAVQDHKRAFEGDEGPNTGGMGSYSAGTQALPFMTNADYEDAVDIIEATVDALNGYKGVLYGQFMLTADGPKVVEFNARFGDPEATNTLSVLETDFLDVLVAARDGDSLPDLSFSSRATVCRYAVPDGYPSTPEAGAEIDVNELESTDAVIFYASVNKQDGGLYTTTSRSLAAVGVEETIEDAGEVAGEALAAVDDDLHVRHDVGTPELVQARIDSMRTLRNS